MKPIHIILTILLVMVIAGVFFTANFRQTGMIRMTDAGPVPITMNPEERILRTYQVDVRYRDEVQGTLNDLLRLHGLGSVEALPNGMLAVMAPFRQHQEIEALIEGVNQAKPEPTVAIQLDYWVIEGSPDLDVTQDAELARLRPVLEQLQDTHGAMGFRVLDSASITSQTGSTATLEGNVLYIQQRASTDGSELNATVNMIYRGKQSKTDNNSQSLNINFTASPGEYLVLGNTTVMDKLYFYIVRWPGLQSGSQQRIRVGMPIQGDVDEAGPQNSRRQ